MTTAAELIQRGFREDNLIPVGDAPSAAEQVEALAVLNSFVRSVYGHELGEPMQDWPYPAPQRTAQVAANYPQLPYPMSGDAQAMSVPLAADATLAITPFPPSNSRLVWGKVDVTAYMPEQPDPGARIGLVIGSGVALSGRDDAVLTLNGNGRLIESVDGAVSATLQRLVSDGPAAWFYREDIGVWRMVKTMALTDDCPFPPEYDDFWICALSMRLAPRYSKTVSEATKLNMQRMLTNIKSHFRQTAPTVYKSQDIPRGLTSFANGPWSWAW